MQLLIYDDIFHKTRARLELDDHGGFTVLEADERTRNRLATPQLVVLDSYWPHDDELEVSFWRPPMDDEEALKALRTKFEFAGIRILNLI